jgi:hypothetical protein
MGGSSESILARWLAKYLDYAQIPPDAHGTNLSRIARYHSISPAQATPFHALHTPCREPSEHAIRAYGHDTYDQRSKSSSEPPSRALLRDVHLDLPALWQVESAPRPPNQLAGAMLISALQALEDVGSIPPGRSTQRPSP